MSTTYLGDWKKRNPEKMALYRRRERLKRVGWTPEEYDAALETQGGVCAICGQPESVPYVGPAEKGERVAGLSADHDHTTGRPRGLLCRRCNSALGYFRDDVALLRKAVEYMEKHQEVAA